MPIEELKPVAWAVYKKGVHGVWDLGLSVDQEYLDNDKFTVIPLAHPTPTAADTPNIENEFFYDPRTGRVAGEPAAADTGLAERTWEQEKAAFNDWANYGEHDPINACVPVEAAKMAWLARAGREAAAREQVAALEREKALLLAVIMFAGAQGNEAETFLNCWSDGSADVDEEWHDWQEHRAALTLARETNDGQ